MKLNSLYIENYKILKDFRIEFRKDVSIFIGINGSGKSTILEAISLIFSKVILGEKSDFKFELSYAIREQVDIESRVKIYTNEDALILLDIETITTQKTGITGQIFTGIVIKTKPVNLLKYLPSSIVIYYSGLSEIMKNICEPHTKQFAKNFRNGITNQSQTFFYYEPILYNIILLSLLSYEFGDIPPFLLKKAGIEKLKSVKIELHKPSWSEGKLIDWWGAKGEVKRFFDFLFENSTSVKNPSNDKSEVIIEHILDSVIRITLTSQNILFLLRDYFVGERELFKVLYALYIGDFISGFEFTFENKDGIFSILSEGEQQAIAIKGLTELVASENTLFLFDEPDTYLHPVWQRNFIEDLNSQIDINTDANSQFVITTHSPQLLSNANPEKSEVQIIEDGEIVKITPKYFGRDISTILYELMGVERRNKKVAKLLSVLFNTIEDEDLENSKIEYEKLVAILGEDDPAMVRAKSQLDYLYEEQNEANS